VQRDNKSQSSLPMQSAWVGVWLLYFALSHQLPMPSQAMALHGGLVGLLAGLGLEQSRKRIQAAVQSALSIRQHILLQTRGRLHDLNVTVSGDRAYVEGYAPSYQVMQVAHCAAIDFVGSSPVSELDFKIRVRKARSTERV
jgi:hypothetical protein